MLRFKHSSLSTYDKNVSALSFTSSTPSSETCPAHILPASGPKNDLALYSGIVRGSERLWWSKPELPDRLLGVRNALPLLHSAQDLRGNSLVRGALQLKKLEIPLFPDRLQ